jgi:diguanylate cyclase (GGDEF)-like protein/PAS domain S-box-containing protein
VSKPAASLLLVGDEELSRDMLGRRLVLHGYRVTRAPDGREALELIKQQVFDLVLLDVMTPEMNGFSVLARIRELHSATELPVILVAAKDQSTDVVQGFQLGANDYVTRPVDFPVALARISTHIAHRRALEALHESEERYALAARGTNDGLWDWDLQSQTIHYSPRWKSMLGFDESEIGTDPAEWLDRVHAEDLPRVLAALDAHREGLTSQFESEYRMLHQDRNYRWMLSRGLAIRDKADRPLRMAGSQTDITGGKVADALTGLPNRVLFVDRLGRAIERARRDPTHHFAVLFLDLDRFKVVNDSLGHRSGDDLLVAISRRLERSLRAADSITRVTGDFTVARLGGDEFTILLEELKSPDDATVVADRILAELAHPFDLGGQEVYVSASIGITLSLAGHDSPQDILRDADTAMYCAKSGGRSRFAVFDDSMREQAVIRLRMETDLRRALERREFRLHYQPILSMESRQIVAFEALVRWQHPEVGLISPADFVPIAEDTGLIVRLGAWVLREACRQMSEWHANYPSDPPLLICVNVSSKQFAQTELVAEIKQVLDETRLDPRGLKLEITEATIMKHADTAVTTLERLRNLGVQVSVDDFGTGYSSLSYLQRFSVDTVKIDRSFVDGMGSDDNMEIIGAIVSLAHTLKLDVIAKGVETEAQRGRLEALDCEYGQGFFYSRPLDGPAAANLLASHRRVTEFHEQFSPLAATRNGISGQRFASHRSRRRHRGVNHDGNSE